MPLARAQGFGSDTGTVGVNHAVDADRSHDALKAIGAVSASLPG